MCLVLAVDKGYRMGNDLSDILVIEHIDSLVLCEGVIEHVHYHTHVIHHVQGVYGTGDVAFVPPIEDHLDTAHPTLYYTYESSVLFHHFIYDF